MMMAKANSSGIGTRTNAAKAKASMAHDLHGERKPAHAGLAETVEGAGVERGDAAHGQHIGGAHGARRWSNCRRDG